MFLSWLGIVLVTSFASQADAQRKSLVGELLRRLQYDAVASEGLHKAGLVLDVLPEKPLRCINFVASHW
jgi:hypothetical protein